jgi:hypothetical protein
VAPELDRALAAGADPLEDPHLLWRAQQLVDPALRLAGAEKIDQLVADAGRAMAGAPYPAIDSGTVELVYANRSLLMVLAERLRGDGPLGLAGLAMVQRLVGVGEEHLYRSPSPLHLKWRLLETLAALEPRSRWPDQ